MRGFPLSVLCRFSLCGSSLSLLVILGVSSPHPKIPFLAGEALAGGWAFLSGAIPGAFTMADLRAYVIAVASNRALRTGETIRPEHREAARC